MQSSIGAFKKNKFIIIIFSWGYVDIKESKIVRADTKKWQI